MSYKRAKAGAEMAKAAAVLQKTQSTLEESLCGFAKSVTTLDARELKVANKAVTVPNQQLKFPNGGMPNQKDPSVKGALIVTFKVTFPPSLTDEQKSLVHQNFST